MERFRYATTHYNGPRWYVEYYCLYPPTGKLKRIRIYVNRGPTKAYRKQRLLHIQHEINARLDERWNPFLSEVPTPKMYEPLAGALDFVLALRMKAIEKSSMPNYKGRINALKEFLESNRMSNLKCVDFTEEIALEFMDWLFDRSNISGRTWNNYLIDYRGFFNTLIDRKYLLQNPFKKIQKRKEKDKSKRPWTQEEQQAFRNYCLQYDPAFYFIAMLCYYFALRPKEICLLKVADVDLQHRFIKVSPEIAKNDRQRILPIPNVFFESCANYLEGSIPKAYLCAREFKPGFTRIAPTRIAERFREIGDILGFDSEVKFYGLKDTCAEQLIRAGVHAKTIQTLFDHTSLKTTDAYLSRISAPQLEQLTGMFPVFGSQH